MILQWKAGIQEAGCRIELELISFSERNIGVGIILVDYDEVAGAAEFKELDGEDFNNGICRWIFETPMREFLKVAS